MTHTEKCAGSITCIRGRKICCVQQNDNGKHSSGDRSSNGKRNLLNSNNCNQGFTENTASCACEANRHAGSPLERQYKPKKKQRAFDWSKVQLQRVLLKIAYNGEAYAGLAAQAEDSGIPTVEDTLFRCMERACLIPNRHACNFSRCGRTDKGVHAAGNYVSLDMRVIQGAAQQDSGGCTVYVPLLNRLLPPDIRVLAATQVPPTFDARFDCLFRVYKYFFGTAGLDISRMRAAAKQFLGMHNFLRFCKVDRKQERSLWRRIIRFDLELQEDGFGVATIVGVSFLWHQVRYMMAALMEVGRGAWPAACISTLLREGLEVEAAVEAAKLDAAEESASMTRAGSTEVEELRLATESCCTALHPAPASNLVLYDCCFEGLYFSRTGAVNRLMLKPGDTEALHSPAKKLREAEADPQNSIAHPESAGKQNSAFEDEGICNTQTACNTNFGFGPRSTEESRTFQDEYMRSAHRMMVLRCLCEHSFPPW